MICKHWQFDWAPKYQSEWLCSAVVQLQYMPLLIGVDSQLRNDGVAVRGQPYRIVVDYI